VYELHPDRTTAFESGTAEKLRYQLYFEGSVRGLGSDAPVEFLGIPVGRVVSVELAYDAKSRDVSIPVLIEIDPERLFGEALDAAEAELRVAQLVERGMKAQLKNANLVTGQLLVELAIYPESEAVTLPSSSAHGILPTMPNTITQISQGLETLLAKFGTLEIEPVLEEIKLLAAELRSVSASPGLKTLPQRLDDLAAALETFVSGRATRFADTLSPEGELHEELAGTLLELRRMADSLRKLSDTLVEKPNALIFGKSKPARSGAVKRSPYDRP
jgi:paraquat-inducible protein B